MQLSLVGPKEFGLVTQSIGLGWPLFEVGARVGAKEDLFQSSPPHKLGIASWSRDRQHYYYYSGQNRRGANPVGPGQADLQNASNQKLSQAAYVDFFVGNILSLYQGAAHKPHHVCCILFRALEEVF